MKTDSHLQMRWMELLVAACFLGVSLLVITDSLRVGNAWGTDGPEPGYFPFYIGCLLFGGAAWIILQTLWQIQLFQIHRCWCQYQRGVVFLV